MAAQILVSLSTWHKHVRLCYKKALLSFDNSIGQPVYSVSLFERDRVVGTTARRALRLDTSLWVTFFKVGDSLAIRTQLPACPTLTTSLSVRSQFRQESPWMTAHFRTAQSQQLLADLRRASAVAIPRWIVARYASAQAESLEGAVSGHQSCATGINSRRNRQKCGVKAAPTALGNRRNSIRDLTARGFMSKAMKGLVCGAAQGPSRMPKDLDHSLDPKELWLRYSLLQYGVRSGCACCMGTRQHGVE